MLSYIKAEGLKQKRSFNNKGIWIIPGVTSLIGFALMGERYAFSGAFNWWYTTFLPLIMTYVAVTIVTKDRRKNYHGLMAVAIDKEKMWYAKVVVATVYLLMANVIFVGIMLVESKGLGLYGMPIGSTILGSLVLVMTFAWQIPLWMFLGQKMGAFISILLSVGCNMIVACLCAVKSYWWIPFAIPARLMCPIVGILPNGFLVETSGKEFANPNVILPGILIEIVLYVILTYVTAQEFKRREV